MIENVSEVIQKYLIEENYKILGVSEEGNIRLRYQLSEIGIIPNSNVPNFVSIIIPCIERVDPDNMLPTLIRCLRLVSSELVVKTYPVDKETVIATYEFFFDSEEDLCFQISNGLDRLLEFRRKYRHAKEEDEEEARKEAQGEDDDSTTEQGNWEEVD